MGYFTQAVTNVTSIYIHCIFAREAFISFMYVYVCNYAVSLIVRHIKFAKKSLLLLITIQWYLVVRVNKENCGFPRKVSDKLLQ